MDTANDTPDLAAAELHRYYERQRDREEIAQRYAQLVGYGFILGLVLGVVIGRGWL